MRKGLGSGNLSRRGWLQLAMAQAAGGTAWQAMAAEAAGAPLEADPFALGVASGHPQRQGITLWTRLIAPNPLRNPWADRPLPVHWELAEDEGFANPVQHGVVQALPELAHSVHVDVTGLEIGQRYAYRFRCGAFTSPTGWTRTLPPADSLPDSLRLGLASCQRYHSGRFEAYAHLLNDAPDLVVFLGDAIYESGATGFEVRGPAMNPATTLSDYRQLYELAVGDAHLQALRAFCPWLVTWDDHEVVNNYAGGPVREGQGPSGLATRMAAAYQAWYEHMPVSPRSLAAAEPTQRFRQSLRIHGSTDWGRLARLHLLDTRQYRSAATGCGVFGLFDPREGCAAAADAARSMLGFEQEAWLRDQLRPAPESGPAGWNLLLQASSFSPYLLPIGTPRLNADSWDGFPAARQRLVDALVERRAANPVVFGGDVHQNWVAHVMREASSTQGEVLMPEFLVTSVSTRVLGSATAQEMLARSPHAAYTDRHLRGYLLAELTPDALTVHLRATGGPAHQAKGVRTSSRLRVRSGNPRIESLLAPA